MRRSEWIAGAAALAIPARASAQALGKITVTTVPIDEGAQSYYAADLGIFAKHGLEADAQSLVNGGDIISAIAGGSIDIGNANVMTVANAHAKNLPIQLLAEAGLYSSKVPTAYILVPEASPIRTAKELNGKTFAVNGLRGITQISVQNWLDKNGADSTSVKFVDMPFPSIQPLLVGGRIDAALLPEPVATFDLAKGGVRILATPFDAIALRFAIGGWVAKTDWIASHMPIVRAFNAAMRETALWANDPKNHEQSAAILLKYTKISVGKANRVLYGEHLVAADIQPEVDVAAKYGVVQHAFPATEMFAPPAARA
jgi:NitT/TauT family transport system substrate-binding protein